MLPSLGLAFILALLDQLHRFRGGRDDSLQGGVGHLRNVERADSTRMPMLGCGFLPACTGLQPEYLSRDVAVAGGVEQKTGDLCVGLGRTEIEFIPVIFA